MQSSLVQKSKASVNEVIPLHVVMVTDSDWQLYTIRMIGIVRPW